MAKLKSFQKQGVGLRAGFGLARTIRVFLERARIDSHEAHGLVPFTRSLEGGFANRAFFPVLFRLLFEDTSSTRGTGGLAQRRPSSLPGETSRACQLHTDSCASIISGQGDVKGKALAQDDGPGSRQAAFERQRCRYERSASGTLSTFLPLPVLLFWRIFLGANPATDPKNRTDGKACEDERYGRAGVDKKRTNDHIGAVCCMSALCTHS